MAHDADMAALRAEHLHIVNKDGAFTEHEIKRLDFMRQIFAAEPELQKLLVALDIRQHKEVAALIEQHKQGLNRPEAGANIYADFQSEHRELEHRHDQERDRYIREHQHADDLLREMDEKRQTLAPDQERKFTR